MHSRTRGVFLGFAVGGARMVDPAGVITPVAAVDDLARTDGEEEGMEGVVGVDGMHGIGLFGRDAPAAVADDARARGNVFGGIDRSEEHTSELQSLMRISYAVLCLK